MTTGITVDAAGWRRNHVESLIGSVVTIVVAGLAIGIGTQILQGVLPRNVGQLANSGAMWALGAAAVGAVMRSDHFAAAAGGIALVIASYSYYDAVDWFEHSSSNGSGARMWAMVGLAVGPVFGVLGRWIRVDLAKRWVAVAAVAGVLLGEGAELIWFAGVRDLWPAGITEMAIGGLLGVAALARSDLGHPQHPDAPLRRLLVLAVAGAAGAVTLASINAIGSGRI
jgi:hypothetical protein